MHVCSRGGRGPVTPRVRVCGHTPRRLQADACRGPVCPLAPGHSGDAPVSRGKQRCGDARACARGGYVQTDREGGSTRPLGALPHGKRQHERRSARTPAVCELGEPHSYVHVPCPRSYAVPTGGTRPCTQPCGRAARSCAPSGRRAAPVPPRGRGAPGGKGPTPPDASSRAGPAVRLPHGTAGRAFSETVVKKERRTCPWLRSGSVSFHGHGPRLRAPGHHAVPAGTPRAAGFGPCRRVGPAGDTFHISRGHKWVWPPWDRRDRGALRVRACRRRRGSRPAARAERRRPRVSSGRGGARAAIPAWWSGRGAGWCCSGRR